MKIIFFINLFILIISSGKNDESLEVDDYYSEINDSLEGGDLLKALNGLNNKKRVSSVGYKGMRQFAAYSDIDPDGSEKIIGFYDNQKIGPKWDNGTTWNREHVWAKL